MTTSITRRRAWAIAGFLFVFLLAPRTEQSLGGFLIGALVLGIFAAAVCYMLARLLDRLLWPSRAALPFKDMSTYASLVFLALILISLHLRFHPLALILGAWTTPMILIATAIESLIALIPILMVLFGDLLSGTEHLGAS